MSGLSLADVVVRYGPAVALHGVSFDVAPGETLAVVGANGAGKSTIGKAIARLVGFAGSIEYNDAVVPTQSIRAGVVYVPEGRMVFPQLTVEENLKVGALVNRRRGDWRALLNVMYERMPRLRERRSVKAGLLSGGEQQLLAIARGLMARPSLLILDEPSLGLSPAAITMVTDFLSELRAEGGITMLVLEQNTTFAARLAERGVLLTLGEITARDLGPKELADAGYRLDV